MVLCRKPISKRTKGWPRKRWLERTNIPDSLYNSSIPLIIFDRTSVLYILILVFSGTNLDFSTGIYILIILVFIIYICINLYVFILSKLYFYPSLLIISSSLFIVLSRFPITTYLCRCFFMISVEDNFFLLIPLLLIISSSTIDTGSPCLKFSLISKSSHIT